MTIPPPALATLQRILGPDRLCRDVSLAPFTTFKLGGAADWYADVRTADELAAVTRTAREHDLPFFLLGTGANVIVGDHGYRGLVIHNRARAERTEGRARGPFA